MLALHLRQFQEQRADRSSFTRYRSSGSAQIITAMIAIRLLGASILRQGASTLDIRSLTALWVLRDRPERVSESAA